jgi:cell division protein DivIC
MKNQNNKGRMISRPIPEKSVSLKVVPPNSKAGQDVIQVEFRRNASVQKRKSQRRFTLIVMSVLALMVMPIIRDLYTYYQLTQDYEQVQQERDALLEVQAQLQEELAELDRPEVIEKLARENLGLVMPGESKIFQAIPTEDIPKQVKVQAGEIIH